jgi:hypothetical protein
MGEAVQTVGNEYVDYYGVTLVQQGRRRVQGISSSEAHTYLSFQRSRNLF